MNWYAEAIKILSEESYNSKTLLFRIAEKHPKAVVESIYPQGIPKKVPDWNDKVRELTEAGEIVPAIKECRAATGWGLRQAKDYVDGLRGR